MSDNNYPPDLPSTPFAPPQTGATAPAYAPPPPDMIPPAHPAPPAPQVPRRRSGGWLAGILGGLLGASLVAGAVYLFPPTRTLPAPTATSKSGTITISTDTKAQPIEAVAAKVTPSVVNIGIEQTGLNPFTGRRGTQVVGNGSGVIIRADGYILTNNHVVEGAERLLVKLGTEDVLAKVVGTDPSTDLAVIKVERTGLPAAEIGSSAALRVGETVIAVGSPFGLDKTVTSGIVSALHRSSLQSQGLGTITQYTNLIQTDAAINPGNSGGALTDILGRVVGINTLIQTGGAQQSAGIGFAIPIDFAKDIAEQLITSGRAVHPYLGISMDTVDSNVAVQLGLPAGTTGVLIQDVVTGSPADKAGITRGDVMTALGGDPITSVEDAFAAIRSRKIGQQIEVVVLRGGVKQALTTTLGSDQGQ
jgi:putative serine protease PepD